MDEQPENAALTPGEDKEQPGIKFRNGRFETDDGTECRSNSMTTELSPTPLSPRRSQTSSSNSPCWAVDTFSLTFDPALIKGGIYGSEISAQLDSKLSEALAPLGTFAELLSKTPFSKQPEAYFPSGVTFNSLSGGVPFPIERRTNTRPEVNVFFSKCMTGTESPVELIRRFDEILGKS